MPLSNAQYAHQADMLAESAEDALLHDLATTLVEEARPANIEELQDLWAFEDSIIICERPMGLEDQPDLPLRLRGALGHQLQALCALPDARADPHRRACPYRLFYHWPAPAIAPWSKGRTELAVPMVIRARMDSHYVVFVIRLFGRARFHLPMVERAAIDALQNGMALRNGGRMRVPMQLCQVVRRYVDGAALDWPQSAGEIVLRFCAPVIIRNQGRLRLEPHSLMLAAMRRVAALAPWMGMTVADDIATFERAVRAADYQLAIHPESWWRYSVRNPGRGIPVHGYAGEVRAKGALAPLLPWLALCEYSSLGSECASGFGAYDMVVWP